MMSTQISTLTTKTTTTDSNLVPTLGNPNPSQTSIPISSLGTILKWVRGIFGMYEQGQLSNSDLIQALQFLIKQGIIKV